MPFLASEGCFWPLTASMTSEVKNNYAYVITQDICTNLQIGGMFDPAGAAVAISYSDLGGCIFFT